MAPMVKLFRLVMVYLLGGCAFAQSSLPPCPSSGAWNNCFGRHVRPDGVTYVGEYQNDQRQGNGVEYRANGSISQSGLWSNSTLVRSYLLDTNRFSLNGYSTVSVSSASEPSSGSIAQSDLPPCPVSGAWNNCLGRHVRPDGVTYVGEYQNDKRQGNGIEYGANGSIHQSGFWNNSILVKSYPLDTNRFSLNVYPQVSAPTLANGGLVDDRLKPSQSSTTIAIQSELESLKREAEEARRKQSEVEAQLRLRQQFDQPITRPPIGKRIALVIGNSNYRIHPLRNPRNDADDVSKALKTSGFEVIDLRDATLQQLRSNVRLFGDRLLHNDVGLVYYSGHGVEVKGRNYFIPVNADIQREDEIADQGFDVSLILEKMNTAGKGVNILIVDACRDDPFGRSFRSSSRGLANMDAPKGTIIAYATSPGKVASDGDGRNSPYTRNLVRVMQQPNKPIEQVFKEVRRAVQEETKNQQTPWENTSLSGDFYFKVQK